MNMPPDASSRDRHLVHGLGRDLVVADWPALTEGEVRSVLSRADLADARAPIGAHGGDVRVAWSSPRPMSAASLVECARGEFFVKRHHVSVRSPERLRVEHAFTRHLRVRGQPLPRVVDTSDGDSVVCEGDFVYEVHEKASGLDLYRDVPSWYPFQYLEHAHAAGHALARFHAAAHDFAAAASPPGVLTNSMDIIASSDPLSALRRLIESRPALARALEGRDIESDFSHALAPLIEVCAPLMERLPSQWGHGDWHPSNMTWSAATSRARVASVLDLGLANRTAAIHDLALAVERSTIDWLDLARTGEVRADLSAADALLDGYETVRRLEKDERSALAAVLPVVHVEFALSEVEYFADVVRSKRNANLARTDYLIGHARWFCGPSGTAFLQHLGRRARTRRGARSTS